MPILLATASFIAAGWCGIGAMNADPDDPGAFVHWLMGAPIFILLGIGFLLS